MTDTSSLRYDGSTRIKRNVAKIAFRSKEKVLQTFGIGDETKDEIIDNYVHLLNKQQTQFYKFQRDMKMYLQSIMAMKKATESFYNSFHDIFDDDWFGKDLLSSLAKKTNLLYDELHSGLNTEVLCILQEHLNQCNSMKLKAGKHGRKIVDFDAARRTFHTLQNSKKLEETKLSKAHTQVTQAREAYETLNRQLHTELPDLHDSRVSKILNVLSSIATAEKSFYIESTEIRNRLMDILSNVQESFDNGQYRIQRLHFPAAPIAQLTTNHDISSLSALDTIDDGLNVRSVSESYDDSSQSYYTHDDFQPQSLERLVEPSPEKIQDKQLDKKTHQYVNVEISASPAGRTDSQTVSSTNGRSDMASGGIYDEVAFDELENANENIDQTETSLIHEVSSTTYNDADVALYPSTSVEDHLTKILPPRFLYKAVAQFAYKGRGDDELSFTKGDVIYVVEFPDPDEQDEGWQMGILRSSWESTGSTSCNGVFPENFTKKL